MDTLIDQDGKSIFYRIVVGKYRKRAITGQFRDYVCKDIVDQLVKERLHDVKEMSGMS